MRGMYLFEIGTEQSGQFGMVIYREGDTVEGIGIIASRTGSLFNQDLGLAIDIVEADNNVLLIYDVMPGDIQDDNDESDFPEYLQKYIECGVLERAYTANTDGRIDSLRDYWGGRYRLGLSVIEMIKGKRKADRVYRLRTSQRPAQRNFRHPRLPDGYPAV